MKGLLIITTLLSLAASSGHATPKGKPSLDPDLYKITEIEDHRDSRNPLLQAALEAKDSRLVARALLALGRIGDPGSAQLAGKFLQNPSIDVRLQAAFALGLIKNADALPLLKNALSTETHADVRGQIYIALGRLQTPDALPLLTAALSTENEVSAQSGLAMGLCYAFLAADSPKWDVPATALSALMNQIPAPLPLGVAAAWGLARYKGDLTRIDEKALIDVLTATKEPEAKAIALKALARFKTDASRRYFTTLVLQGETAGVRAEAAAGLIGQAADAAAVKALLQAAGSDQNQVRASALQTLATYKNLDAESQAQLKTMTQSQPSPWLQGKAWLALAASLQGEALNKLLLEGLQHKDFYVQREIIAILPQAGEEGLKILQSKVDDPSILIAGAALYALHDLEPQQMNDSLKASMLKQLKRQDVVMTSLVIDAAGKFGWPDALPALTQAAEGKTTLADYAIQENLMGTLAVFADPKTLPIVEKNLQHPVRNVVVKAFEAYQKITGKNPDRPLPLNNRVDEPTPALASIQKALGSELILETSKGTIRVHMLDAAPLTATKVIGWAAKGFYDGLNFHRVVPHFVVQGGDPRGDGEGGDGMIRDEVSMVSHMPYTLGIATSGKDTGSTQMFFNHGNNSRLDGSYTVFALVVSGRDVVDRLEVGDKIIRAQVVPIRAQ